MITNYESPEFMVWWAKDHDPSETGRGRMLAANAFEAGRALERRRATAESETSLLLKAALASLGLADLRAITQEGIARAEALGISVIQALS